MVRDTKTEPNHDSAARTEGQCMPEFSGMSRARAHIKQHFAYVLACLLLALLAMISLYYGASAELNCNTVWVETARQYCPELGYKQYPTMENLQEVFYADQNNDSHAQRPGQQD